MHLSENKSQWCVYITTCGTKTTLYTGSTNNIRARLTEHYLNSSGYKTFAGKYNCYWLLYYEEAGSMFEARQRESQIKKWRREKKIDLIESLNPEWKFLNYDLFDCWPPLNPVHRSRR